MSYVRQNKNSEEDIALQSKIESVAGENIKLLADINKLQNAIPFMGLSG